MTFWNNQEKGSAPFARELHGSRTARPFPARHRRSKVTAKPTENRDGRLPDADEGSGRARRQSHRRALEE